jgi:hypothetical protein
MKPLGLLIEMDTAELFGIEGIGFVKLGWKSFPRTNTPAYYKNS